jgi:UDP-N-acetylglucosamine 4-epimerase
MIADEDVFINGDGETSRDFCFVENAVQANILAATADNEGKNQVYNVALGDRTSLNTLFNSLKVALKANGVDYKKSPCYRDFRAGDVRHSQADITKAKSLIGFEPEFKIQSGIDKAMPWYINFIKQ